ncbi:sulfite exporter TauE/SafE family protein [Aurantiacibacter sp. D1-12]|uniref:sulfite exporter TauE/SafE family protein n=1 Tax=Aurantiacibacter sp. D1-12 TaxID=2993658 RepID=UPI00237CAA76|nr:sulfite exporter TauE/SafE family protein [Aurantiacibacter sp. D1-12]MDE1468246.1 sulfite exporter TauE/SafE family protein [Aurantiacibacter sp. D1-12]
MEILDGFSTTQIVAAVVATLGAAFVRGLTGFGFGFLLAPILALALLPLEAVLLVNVLAFSLALSEIRYVLREADRSAYWIMGLLILTTMPGLLLLSMTPPPLARVLIALAALTAFLVVVFPRSKQPRPPGKVATGATGLIAGVMTGFAAMPGISVVPYYVRQDMPRVMAKASMIGIFGVSALASLTSGAITGLLEWRLLVFGLLLFPVMALGNWLGSLVFGRVSDPVWRAFVGIVLGAAAVAALLKL